MIEAASGGDTVRRARPLLGTIVEITAVGGAPDAVEQAFRAIAEVQGRMSFHDPESELSVLNRTAHLRGMRVSAPLWEVLTTADRLFHETAGAFDVTVAARLIAWGYLPRGAAPTRLLARASGRDVILHPAAHTVSFAHPLALDLGGIAKGYAVDCAVTALVGAGVSAGCVNAGGDLRVFGERLWPVCVRHPAAPEQFAQGLALRNTAVATSAGYFTRRRRRGREVSPLVDGRSRAPCDTAGSVSVIAASAMLADALTKAVLALGSAAEPLLEARGASALLLAPDGSHTTLCGLRHAA